MIKLGRVFFVTLSLLLLICIGADSVPTASAASAMTASKSCVDFVKKAEGFSEKPFYDYNQHTVGYGTKCPSDRYFDYLANGISKKEAEALLMDALAEVSQAINQNLIQKYGLSLNQHQFDALVSFSFNIGTGWMTYDSTLRDVLVRNGNDSDFVYAISLYCTAGGKYSSGLITRRLCEANIYLNGIYSQKVGDDFGYVYYEANGGSLTYRVQGYLCESNSVPIANASRKGDVFLGWYTNVTGGSQVTVLTKKLSGKTLFARWESSENTQSEDTASTPVKVTGDVVNIRKGPGTNYGIATQVYRNDVLIVTHVTHLTNMKWGKVQDGWICLDYTNYDAVINGSDDTNAPSPTEPTVPETSAPTEAPESNSDASQNQQTAISGVVRVNDLLRIRGGAGTEHATVGYLSNGQSVTILEQKTVGTMVWGRISRGWVSMDYIVTEASAEDPPTPPSTEPPEETEPPKQTEPPKESEEQKDSPDSSDSGNSTPEKGYIIADVLRIRSGAGTSYSIEGFYYEDDVVLISEKVKVDSVYWGRTGRGWINMDYVSPYPATDEPQSSADASVKTVIADCLRVRKGTGTDKKIAALLYFGDKVMVFETISVDGILWGRVDNGWICMDYVA